MASEEGQRPHLELEAYAEYPEDILEALPVEEAEEAGHQGEEDEDRLYLGTNVDHVELS